MCGIIGYIGEQDCISLLVEGLRRLEYRGYDSAGIAVISDSRIEVRRCEGKLQRLEQLLKKRPVEGTVGIGHTRWATHGPPSERNAHPHQAGPIAVVHNGIIENYLQLKHELTAAGCKIRSETDTEIIAQLVCQKVLAGVPFVEAVYESLEVIEGSYALVILNEQQPDTLIAVRKESPLILGLAPEALLVASDIPAILGHTRDMVFLEDGEVAILGRQGYEVRDEGGAVLAKEVAHISWNPVMAEKAGYKHFMQKEIYEQPRAVIDTFRGRVGESTGDIYLDDINLDRESVARLRKIVIVACGTSYHAGLVGKYLLENLSALPVEVDLGSEFRYRNPLVDERTLLVLISQSGETADTLAAMREGKAKEAFILSICNVVGSSLVRQSDGILYTHAGPEIGVASTKAFTTQLVALYLLALYLGRKRDKLTAESCQEAIADLVRLPKKMEAALGQDRLIRSIAEEYAKARDFLYLGRGIHYPIALEGALKMKEISYVHAEGYPAGEMKHGPIALIDEHMPVVALASSGVTFEKMLANIEEVKARRGKIIVVADQDNCADKVDAFIPVPRSSPYLATVLFTIPLQLLAYHVAVLRGTDVDQPRNLAKSVTVE
ncbi:MAG: glutamine--fructose-6-phosphate transaminase (isomerizing) [Deltaproteobacteria bacterium]|nr:glutamine--fructose-6-phosphate transaminase (isomerizing) [Deltaproteobacteria bacterium]MBW2071727.1 glutamine--fructose-6-phosphate transaminase (isomerizing) [Deltaproteobacteria bacterium]